MSKFIRIEHPKRKDLFARMEISGAFDEGYDIIDVTVVMMRNGNEFNVSTALGFRALEKFDFDVIEARMRIEEEMEKARENENI